MAAGASALATGVRHRGRDDSARGWLCHGGLRAVWAETMALNQTSRKVMAKLGMRHVRTDHRQWDAPLPGSDQGEVVYAITREERSNAR